LVGKKVKIVLFDVDGVLVDEKSSWHVIHRYMGVEDEADRGTRMYLEGIIDYLGWMKHDTRAWSKAKRIHISDLKKVFEKIPIRPEAVDVARKLHRKGYLIGLVSAGIDLLVARVAREVGADVWIANKLSYDKAGYLVEGGVPLVPAEKKDYAVKKILGELGLKPEEAAFVGDSVWDIPAFLIVGTPIGYGGDPRIAPYVKYMIHSLTELPGILEGLDY
jgi:phosphoserine phosphatase